MRAFHDHVRWQHRVLYVSKGPTAERANEWLHFGDVATMNDSSLLVEGPIDYSFMADLEAVVSCRTAWPRIKTFMVPDYFHVNANKSPVQATWIPGFPAHRAVYFPVEPIVYTDDETREAISTGNNLCLCNAASVGLHILAILGYRQIWCLGHDGGKSYASRFAHQPGTTDHTPVRYRLELMSCCLRDKYGTEVRFWPDHFAEQAY